MFLKLDKPSNQIAATAHTRGSPVYYYFWAPKGPPPFFLDMHGYLLIAGDDWAAGSPVDDGLLAAVTRKGACHAGARYQGAQLWVGDRLHRLRDVYVTGCRPAREGKAEWMTLAFAEAD